MQVKTNVKAGKAKVTMSTFGNTVDEEGIDP
jgi:hypothetical protein